MFWRLWNDGRCLMHSFSEEWGVRIFVRYGRHWGWHTAACLVIDLLLTPNRFLSHLDENPKLLSHLNEVINLCSSCYPHVSPLSIVPLRLECFSTRYSCSWLLNLLNEWIDSCGTLCTFQGKKIPHKYSQYSKFQSIHSRAPLLGLLRRNICSSRLRLFTSFLCDIFITWVLHVCSRKQKKSINRKMQFLPHGTQLGEEETLSLGLLMLWPGLWHTGCISALKDPGEIAPGSCEAQEETRGWGKDRDLHVRTGTLSNSCI